MKNKRYLFLSLGIIFLIVFSLYYLNSFSNFNFRNILGNVANIDISSLKIWQQNSGFKKNLSPNDKNNDVFLLQKALSTDSEIYREGAITGFLGKSTKKALILFQKENNIPVTGLFDEKTRGKMNEIFYNELCPTQTVEYPDFTDFVFSKNENKLPDDFIPKNLKNIQDANVKSMGGIICLRADALESLKNMFEDAKKDRIFFAVTSGFRKPAIQEWLVNYYISLLGEDGLNVIAQPGYSEHQLGTAVDLTGSSMGYRSTDHNFENTVEYNWLQKNANRYGFFMSYPIGNSDYIFEPWHYRFLNTKK